METMFYYIGFLQNMASMIMICKLTYLMYGTVCPHLYDQQVLCMYNALYPCIVPVAMGNG